MSLPSRAVLFAVIAAVAPLAATSAWPQGAPPDSLPIATAPSPAARPDSAGAPGPAAHGPHRLPWALVLSGGSARGLAHIGILRALEEEGIRPSLVCGTSMGALIGALYASGRSSAEIRDIILGTDWNQIFGEEQERFEWRDTVVPDPWLVLIGEGLQLHLPSGVIDDSYLNFTLVEYFLSAEGRTQGDFDRLPIPFRCVGTDAETTNPVIFKSGSIARAVRTSISIPPLFPAVPQDSTLLVDGGLASNMPVSTARTASPDRILAVDVSLPNLNLSDRSSLLEVSFSIFDRLNKRSQQDTLSSQDRLVWLKLPGYGPMDFAASDSLIELGYREGRALVHEFAQLVRATSDTTRHDSLGIALPPARPHIAWLDRDGRESVRADLASRNFGPPPPGVFDPAVLGPSFKDVYRSDLFISAWPSFRVENDSTTIAMNVESRPASELLFAFGYDNDLQSRVNGTLVLRPLNPRLPDKISVGANLDPQRRNVFFALEPHSLARGSDGWFVRGGWRRTDVRLFDEDRNVDKSRVDRVEGTVGGQRRLTSRYLLQAGTGYGFAGGDARDLSGLLGSVRVQSGSAFGEGIQTAFLVGAESYATVIVRATTDIRVRSFTLRTSARAGSSSRHTPPDELQALGGPDSFAGLRRREWLGHDRLAGEVRLLRNWTSSARYFAYVQAGTITGTASRPDLDGAVHFAVGAGFEAAVPFGPLNLDWGVDDLGEFRLDFNFGQRF